MGIELVQDREKREPFEMKRRAANRLQWLAMEHGVMGYPTVGIKNGVSGDALLVSPPFIITEPVIDEAFDRLDAAITAFEKEYL
jgi:adenosylmethionine-8-amino-7-oxononanoate aminotransferase